MKKLFALAAASVLVLSAGMLSACVAPLEPGGVNEDGSISGNYEEVDKEGLGTALSAVTLSTVLGDTQEENWTLHFSAKTGGDFSLTIGSGAAATSVDLDLDAEGALSLALDETEKDIAFGGMSFSLKNAGLSVSGEKGGSGTAQGDLCLAPDGTFYADLALKSGEDEIELKGKETVSSVSAFIGSLVGGMVPFAEEVLPEEGEDVSFVQITQQITLGNLFDMFEQYSVKVELDDSDGYVFRLTASHEALASMLEGTSSSLFTFGEGNVTLYLSLDENYFLRAVSVVADISVSMEASLSDMAPSMTADINASASLSVTDESAVKLPDDPDSYTKGIFEQLFGSASMPGANDDVAAA